MAPKGKGGKKKMKRKRKAEAAAALAPKPKVKPNYPPNIKYKYEKIRFQCYYNNLPCTSFKFTNRKEEVASKKAAEEICRNPIRRDGIFLSGRSRDGVRPSKSASERCHSFMLL